MPLKLFLKQHMPRSIELARSLLGRAKYVQSRQKARKLAETRNPLMIELGAGNKAGDNGWITIDVTPACDLFWDLRNGIPFPDGSVKKIYSSHFFEHLSYKQTQNFLDECLRVLAPGGTFSICVPNARIYLEAYVNRHPLDHATFFLYAPAYNNTTAIDAVNYMAYMSGEHQYMFDEENLVFLLSKKGFRNARLRPLDPALDLQVRDYESIYAEAEK